MCATECPTLDCAECPHNQASPYYEQPAITIPHYAVTIEVRLLNSIPGSASEEHIAYYDGPAFIDETAACDYAERITDMEILTEDELDFVLT